MAVRRYHTLLFLVMLLMDIFDLISDWMLYVDVKLATKGLVFGPIDPVIVKFLLAFSIIGTLAFIVEIANLYVTIYIQKQFIDSDALSAAVIWLEDVPQIIISFDIALCREEAISIFQLTKAALVLIGVLMRIVLTSVMYCNKKAIGENHHVKLKAIIFIGILVEGSFAAAVFWLTNMKKDDTGNHTFRVPQTLVRDHFEYERYFAGVGVFVHHRDVFDYYKNNRSNYPEVNWIRATWLDDVRENGVVHFKYGYQYQLTDLGEHSYNLTIWRENNDLKSNNDEYDNDDDMSWEIIECFRIRQNYSYNEVKRQSLATCNDPRFMEDPNVVVFTFKFTPPSTFFQRRVLGHIVFNAKMQGNEDSGGGWNCDELMQVTDDIENESNVDATITVQFYRIGSQASLISDINNGSISISSGNHREAGWESGLQLGQFEENQQVFYINDGKSLLNVKDVWKTGWRECPMSGYLGPPQDSNLYVPCRHRSRF